MENQFIEFDAKGGDKVLIKSANITLISKLKPSYPNFETQYKVIVNMNYWILEGQEGEVVYAQYREYLKSCVKQ